MNARGERILGLGWLSSSHHPAIGPGTVASSGSGVMRAGSRFGVVTDASAIPVLRGLFTGVQRGFRADLAAEDAGVPGAVGRAVAGEHLDGIWRLAGREPSPDRIISRMSDAGIHHGPPKDDLAVERIHDECAADDIAVPAGELEPVRTPADAGAHRDRFARLGGFRLRGGSARLPDAIHACGARARRLRSKAPGSGERLRWSLGPVAQPAAPPPLSAGRPRGDRRHRLARRDGADAALRFPSDHADRRGKHRSARRRSSGTVLRPVRRTRAPRRFS
ncbi:hypothetical protein PARU111607_09585 [Palleronia rufa]